MKSYPMKVAIVVLFGLLGSLAFLNLINCNGDDEDNASKCCPEIISFLGLPQYLCIECAGANETAFYCTVKFRKGEGEKKETCEPPKDFKSSIKNLNSGSELPPLQWNVSPPGTYQGIFKTLIDQAMLDAKRNVTFSLTVEGEKGCRAEKKVTIHAVKDGDTYTLDLNKMNSPEICILSGDTNLFGEGVMVSQATNKTNFNVYVSHYGRRVLIHKGETKPDFNGLPANGPWEAEVAEETSDPADRKMCNQFLQLPKDQKKITLELVLTCKCK